MFCSLFVSCCCARECTSIHCSMLYGSEDVVLVFLACRVLAFEQTQSSMCFARGVFLFSRTTNRVCIISDCSTWYVTPLLDRSIHLFVLPQKAIILCSVYNRITPVFIQYTYRTRRTVADKKACSCGLCPTTDVLLCIISILVGVSLHHSAVCSCMYVGSMIGSRTL